MVENTDSKVSILEEIVNKNETEDQSNLDEQNELTDVFESIYETIQPQHINIRDLHVDSALKPDHLQSNSWLMLSAEERRRNSIQQFVKNETSEILKIENLTSKNSQSSNRSSHDYNIPSDYSSVEGSQDGADTLSGSIDSSQCPSKMINEIIGHQAGLRNERNHFLLCDMLISRFQKVLCETEMYVETCKRRHKPLRLFNQNLLEQATLSESIENNKELTKSTNFTSQADHVAICLMKEMESHSREIGAYSIYDQVFRIKSDSNFNYFNDISDPFNNNGRPSQLNSPDSDYSSLLINTPRPSIQPGASKDDTQPSELLIRAAVSGHKSPNSIPVGGRPQLAPDLSLPNYVASKSPPAMKRSAMLERQRDRCPGCNTLLAREGMKRLRVCRYYGLLFCSSCHGNTLMIIPANILQHWDFSMVPVSRPARDLLHLIHSAPIFQLSIHFSSSVRSSIKPLINVVRLRIQAAHLLVFIRVCRQGTPLMKTVSKIPNHWIDNKKEVSISNDEDSKQQQEQQQQTSSTATPDKLLFSMSDLQLIESGQMEKELRLFVTGCIEHVSLCPLCQARGFICELCMMITNDTITSTTNSFVGNDTQNNSGSGNDKKKKDDILFPFEIDRVLQCSYCHACVHKSCYKKLLLEQQRQNTNINNRKTSWWCRRCQRINARRLNDDDSAASMLQQVITYNYANDNCPDE